MEDWTYLTRSRLCGWISAFLREKANGDPTIELQRVTAAHLRIRISGPATRYLNIRVSEER